MNNYQKKFGALREDIKSLTAESPEARKLVATVSLERMHRLISEPEGLLELFRSGKAIVKPGDDGSVMNSEKATKDLNKLLSEIETCYDLASQAGRTVGRK